MADPTMEQTTEAIERAQQTDDSGTGGLRAVPMTGMGIQFHTMDDAWRLAQAIVAAGFAPRAGRDPMTATQVMIAIQMGAEVGMPPMTALKNIVPINGRPTIWGDAVLALVESKGLLAYIHEEVSGEGDDRAATVTVQRRGRDYQVERTFSVADAKRAGLWGKAGPWKDYPDRMLQMRARGFALRDTFPDALGGYMLTEEARDMREVDPDAPQGGQVGLLRELRGGGDDEVE